MKSWARHFPFQLLFPSVYSEQPRTHDQVPGEDHCRIFLWAVLPHVAPTFLWEFIFTAISHQCVVTKLLWDWLWRAVTLSFPINCVCPSCSFLTSCIEQQQELGWIICWSTARAGALMFIVSILADTPPPHAQGFHSSAEKEAISNVILLLAEFPEGHDFKQQLLRITIVMQMLFFPVWLSLYVICFSGTAPINTG